LRMIYLNLIVYKRKIGSNNIGPIKGPFCF